jgi:hypothetical protein
MTVAVKGTAFRGMVTGPVVAMPTPTVYVIRDEKTGQYFTAHDDEILRFEYSN